MEASQEAETSGIARTSSVRAHKARIANTKRRAKMNTSWSNTRDFFDEELTNKVHVRGCMGEYESVEALTQVFAGVR